MDEPLSRGDGDPDALGVYPGEDNPDYVPCNR
jgi:hypothetical protein